MTEPLNWRLRVENDLDALADVLVQNAEEQWEADVHWHIVEAWDMLRHHRQASRDDGRVVVEGE